jgi:hypothetical protein
MAEVNPSYEKLYNEFKKKVSEVFGESRKGGREHEQRN